MRYFIIAFLILDLSGDVFSQINREKDDFSVEAISNYVYIPDFGSKVSYGLQAEGMLSKNFGFQASATGTKDYVTFNGLALLVPLGIFAFDKDNSSGSDYIRALELFFWATLVENPTLHIKLNNRMELVTYASLCRVRYWWNEPQPFASSWMASGSIGFKLGYFLPRNWYINFSSEYTQLYYSGRPRGFQIGISMGRILKSRG